LFINSRTLEFSGDGEGGRRRLAGGGWPAVAGRLRRRRRRVGAKKLLFFIDFCSFSPTPSSGPISHLKFLIQQIPSPRSTKEERKFYTFILGLDLSLYLPFELIRSSIPLVRFRQY